MFGKDFLLKQMMKKLPADKQEELERMVQDPDMQKKVQELLAKLSSEDQQKLMSAFMSGDMGTVQEIISRADVDPQEFLG